MSNIKKLMMSAAGGDALDVDDVFSTYVYAGNSESTQAIVNNIDLSGEGGMVWIKTRTENSTHKLFDTERGVYKYISSGSKSQELSDTASLKAFNSNGFDLGSNADVNRNNHNHVSWTFRKAPKFFDVVTWTGNGVNGRSISHSLNSLVGMITVKCTSTDATNWSTWHRGASGTLWLNSTVPDSANGGGQATSGFVYNPGSNTSAFSVDNGANVNQSGRTYVAYLFAHNNGDGGFGPDGDQDIIKCGSYLNNNAAPVHIDLGWEPQWVLVRNVTDFSPWTLQDNMRGLVAYENDNYTKKLEANAGAGETDIRAIQPTSTGFYVPNSIDGAYNSGNAAGTRTHIYMAIRRGSLFPPEAATDVFAMDTYGSTTPRPPALKAGFPVDFGFWQDKNNGGDWQVDARLNQGKRMTFSTGAQVNSSASKFDYQTGYINDTYVTSTIQGWMWKRAPGYFDVVAYTGTGATPTVINHNLNVAPEMMLIKSRTSNENWMVYHSALGNTKAMVLTSATPFTANTWNNTTPSATTFTLGGGGNNGSQSGQKYIAYLFATLPGISKVGSYTGTTASQVINCGFTAGARLVIIKSTDANANWFILDTERGITTTSNDGVLYLSATQQQYTEAFAIGYNIIEPDNSGFKITGNNNNINKNGDTYIFYAIA